MVETNPNFVDTGTKPVSTSPTVAETSSMWAEKPKPNESWTSLAGTNPDLAETHPLCGQRSQNVSRGQLKFGGNQPKFGGT